ncbi:long-chain fatty acid--CoA ligase [Herbidospora cretacea]|uniref:long-chain fatty acid--CoA ligase n=1 Tax=Herbidospora cretacea TaxID=28444 RepID=UPI000AF2F871|nr:long-chain fatty acid--CoA ligase [Herbidospora cretacea]
MPPQRICAAVPHPRLLSGLAPNPPRGRASARPGESGQDTPAPDARDARVIDARTDDVYYGPVLRRAVQRVTLRLARLPQGLLMLAAPATAEVIVTYLAALRSGRPVAPVDPRLVRSRAAELVTRFAPAALLGAPGAPPPGYRVDGRAWVRTDPGAPVHPDLAVVLLDGPGGMRLSRRAVQAEGEAVARALRIRSGEATLTSPPLYTGAGLALLNAHLAAGAAVVAAEGSVAGAEFWAAAERWACGSFAASPRVFALLRRLGWAPVRSLRNLTMIGGAPPEGFSSLLYGVAATPPGRSRPGSVGPALPGGRLSIVRGEVVYEGDTVGMGSVRSAADLARGDDLRGVLRTGERGRLDADGYLHLARDHDYGDLFDAVVLDPGA